MPAKESTGVWVRWGLPIIMGFVGTAIGLAFGAGVSWASVTTRLAKVEKDLPLEADRAASRIAHSVAASRAQEVAYNEGLIINSRIDLIEQVNQQRREQLDKIQGDIAAIHVEMVQVRILMEKHIAADTPQR